MSNQQSIQQVQIQQLLANTDYSFKNFIPSTEALMLFQFIKEVNNGKEEHDSPLVHALMIDKMCNPSRRTAIMAFRGCAKSSLIEYFILYLACFGELGSIKDPKFIMFIANNIEKGVKTFRNGLEGKYQNSPFLQKMIPNQNLRLQGVDPKGKTFNLSDNDLDDIQNAGRSITDVRITFKNINGQPLTIQNFGIVTGVRGSRENNTRPTMAIIDDILKDDDANSDTIISKIEDIIYNNIPYALHPTKQKMIWVGTPFHSNDPLYKAIESGVWDSLVLPICEKFPCEEKDFKPAWPDRFTYNVVQSLYDDANAKGDRRGFYQEIMLQVVSDELRLVRDDNIHHLDNLPHQKESFFNYYITTDFAFSEKTSADNSVISVWALTNNDDLILVDGICEKQPIDLTIRELFRLIAFYKPLQVGMEITGQQQGFVSWVKKEMYKTNIYFNIKEVRPTKDKLSRFLAIVPRFHSNKVMISSNLRNKQSKLYIELMDELQKATIQGFKSKHDDVLDTISMLLDLDLYTPYSNTAITKEEDKEMDYLFNQEYLNTSNTQSYYI